MRSALLRLLRATHLIGLADWAAAQRAVADAREANAAYAQAHPERAFPDPRLVFEVAGHAYLQSFDESGAQHAALIAALLREHGISENARILEWGCGPGRILTHVASALPHAHLFGCDPDRRSIAHMRNALPAIDAQRIERMPPAPYPAASFDAVYGVSIFTHLSANAASAWASELARLLTGDGLAIVTTHGASAAERLTPEERAQFDGGEYVVRGGASVGSRAYASYFNEAAGRRLFEPHFEAVELRPDDGAGFGQDVWLLGRPRRA